MVGVDDEKLKQLVASDEVQKYSKEVEDRMKEIFDLVEKLAEINVKILEINKRDATFVNVLTLFDLILSESIKRWGLEFTTRLVVTFCRALTDPRRIVCQFRAIKLVDDAYRDLL